MFLVTGATGNVGSELVTVLTAGGEQVRALVRDPAQAPPGAQPVRGDLNEPETFAEAFNGVRGVFLMPGYQNMVKLLELARQAGVERIVLLSGGSAATGDMGNAVARYMIDSERAVGESGLSWTFLRPRSFMSNALRWLPQLRKGDLVRVPFGDVPVAAVDPSDIAAVAARALVSDGHVGKIYDLTGPESLLPAQQVETLGKVLGRDLVCESLSNEEAHAEMSASMPPEYVAAFFSFFVDGTLDESEVFPAVEEVAGRPARTFAGWAQAHADAFR